MSQTIKRRLEVAALCLVLAGWLWGIVGAVVLLPARMDAAEKRATAIEQELDSVAERQAANREMLVRIEERLIAIQNELRRQP